jgi:hypothetical protein
MTKARDIASAIPAPSTVDATELGYLDGVTSAIQTQLDAKTAKSTLTTTGDIYYASAANTPARLGIGTASQLLAVNSGATAPEWVAAPSSGGMTLLSTTTLSGATTTITVTGGYNYILAVIYGQTNNTAHGRLYIAPNGTANQASATGVAKYTGGGGSARVEGYDNGYIDLARGYDILRTNANNAWVFTMYNYTSSTNHKPYTHTGTYIDNDSTKSTVFFGGTFHDNTAVTSLVFSNSAGNQTAGTVLLYGVK